MPNIFNYLNYRDFLRDYYQERKTKSPSFSYAKFAKLATFHTKSFLPHVIKGKKNISQESAKALAKAIGLKKKSFSYFLDLVAFCHSKSLRERNQNYEKLLSYNQRNWARQVKKAQYEFYTKWYYNTIRELVTIVDFKEDYHLLAKMMKPAISTKQAREAVRVLLRLGLLRKQGGRYIQTSKHVTTGDEVRSMSIQNFHIQNLVLAADTVSHCAPEERDLSALVAGLSKDGFHRVKAEIQRFRKRLVEIIDQDKTAERVYHINFQLLPTSEAREQVL